MTGLRVTAPFMALLMIFVPLHVHAQDVQIWLDSGAIEIELQNGEVVTLDEGEYLSCEDTLCEILPLASAPAAPSIAQILGSAVPTAGGLASGALGLSAGTIAAAGISGAAVIAAGVAIGVAAASSDSATGTTSTTGTQ